LPLAAVLVLCLTLGILAYKTGMRRGVLVARQEQGTGGPARTDVAVEAVNQNRDATHAEIADRDKAIHDLRSQMALESAEIAKLKALQSEQQRAAETSEKEKKQLTAERDGLAQQLKTEQAALAISEKKLTDVDQQRSGDVARLQASVAQLSRTVNEQERATDQQQELLSHDRDIRELMGARDRRMAPLIPPGSFVQIDAKQTRVKKGVLRRSRGQSQFRRPIYFVDLRDGYACGWCQIEDGVLTLVPHPESPEKVQTFRHPAEAEIVGRVTGIAMRIAGGRLVTLKGSFGRRPRE
jgi:hypothetical protein